MVTLGELIALLGLLVAVAALVNKNWTHKSKY